MRGAVIDALWPDADFVTPLENDNDLSVVLSVRVAGRRILFCGDIQKLAIAAMLARGHDLHADVTDMPHHGSMVPGQSLAWLQAVNPSLAIQSSGRRRMENDPWKNLLPVSIHRLQTAATGMIELDIHHDGQVKWKTFQEPAK